jgi:hypothetical protein
MQNVKCKEDNGRITGLFIKLLKTECFDVIIHSEESSWVMLTSSYM